MTPETDVPPTPATDTLPPAEDIGFRDRHLPGTPAGEARGILPAMAAIGMYLLFRAMIFAFEATRNRYGGGTVKYSTLTISTLLVIGVFGMFKLRRWGWALVTGGCISSAVGYFLGFHYTRDGSFLINGLFLLLFFLYLSRPEVRDRLR